MISRGVAYANRAAAFLALRSYEDSLESVRLAKKCYHLISGAHEWINAQNLYEMV